MNEDRHVVIHFNNGSKLELSMPVQIKNSTAAVIEAMKKIMESDKLVIEAENHLIMVPWASVKQLEVTPPPPALPFGAIKGAKIIG